MSINRRDVLKLGSVALAAGVTSTFATATESTHAPVRQWEVFEVTLPGPSTGNPFSDVQLSAIFLLGHRTVAVDGFYDGGGTYKVRFMPDTAGYWTYTTSSNQPALAGNAGKLTCIVALANAHGPVRVRNTHHVAYADGTPFFPFGTTCDAWVHQSEELQQQTLESLRTAPFNKVRMCVFPRHYEYRTGVWGATEQQTELDYSAERLRCR